TILSELGVDAERLCRQSETRLYPFGAKLFHLLGDLNTRVNWGAPATIYVEREYYSRLRGFDDRSERVPLKIVRSKISDKEDPATAEEAGGADQLVIVRQGGDDESLDEAGIDSNDDRVASDDRQVMTVIKRDYREILPLLRHRHTPDHPAVKAILSRERNVRLSIDLRLQLRASEILGERLRTARVKRGAAVVIDPPTGDILAAVSYPWPGEPFTPNPAQPGMPENPREDLVDRAFAALRPPGSTFKIVTAMAALGATETDRQDQRFECRSQANGRVGFQIPGFRRAVLDAAGDSAHGQPNMEEAIVRSCNAYFAQLGLKIGPQRLLETADRLGIRVAARSKTRSPEEVLAEGENLLQAGYGQGQVIVTPFQMARVAATVANGGVIEAGRWVIDDGNRRTDAAVRLVSPDNARFLVQSMRGVVTRGTASNAASSSMAGKTGTAQVKSRVRYISAEKVGFRDERGNLRYLEWKRGEPIPAGLRPAFYEQPQTAHGWFIGIAPFDSNHPIAFSVLMENGGSGRGAAVPVADRIVAEALRLGMGK
ncbi:MAG: penicillin-binding transpeptidase domain-containing protein, partial [Blastocatellia bacterium]